MNLSNPFPPHSNADEDGLLCYGGNLSPDLLLTAYQNGIFPWYDEPPILWYSPDPRFVLFPNELKISKSMRPLFNKHAFDFTVNKAFKDVMKACGEVNRNGQSGTWINEDMLQAYSLLHEMGFAQSAEVWKDGLLVGGLYGLLMGNVFFGESMFSLVSNASKYAFISYVKLLEKQGVVLIDCQVYTEHLESLGARMISRTDFLTLLKKQIPEIL